MLEEENHLEKLLEDKSDAYRARILQLVISTGIDATDPVFLLLVASGRLEVMLEDLPMSLEKSLHFWVKESVEQLSSSVSESSPTRNSWGLPQYLAVGLISLAAMLGSFFGATLFGNHGTSANDENAEVIAWLNSKEGKLAQNLIEWNAEYLQDGQCQNEAKELNFNLSVDGAIATSGFCALWVVPPDERKFREID